ncbi:UDP-N-acetylglucosamine pyrophosphorylase [Macrophomina phaseolina]|uniref:UDP-N-acetylglucosamine diphosphorylase n=1 Tax=Macrophomina phaseolina TaxID=35725 RepID=A0ABQ8GWG8_9PEZI|nr:UDP-N-acetylglucosamine pyrophosphorylase [Macrophomina phaseolina]
MAGVIKDIANKITGSSSEAAPREPTAQEVQELRQKYEKAGQEQVFAFWDQLSSSEKGTLYAQLSGINPDYVNEITNRALNPPKTESDEQTPKFEPLPSSATSSVLDSEHDDLSKWYDAGLELIAENKVAVVLMAGGQGTRLGSSAPKGCFDIGLPSHKSLFQLQAERIWKVQQLAKKKHGKSEVIVPWYVMTSGPTRGPTEQFFQEHNYFGLDKANVTIFEQGVLPCISNDGKILLESKSKVAVAPDGNGGLYQALITSSVVADMSKRGIQHVHAYCVDNCLVKVADPTFIGFSASKDVEIATKVVRKRNAKESVGLIMQRNGKPDVVEYSEISEEMAEARDSSNSELLKFRAANIVNHYYSFRFLESIPQWSHRLPHHIARKKIPYVDTESGNTVKPEKPNGIKLEQFVFDCFPFLSMDKFACMEVKREDEFSPLKNARGTGEDDPDTSKKDIMDQGKKWVQAAGGVVVGEKAEDGVEVSPLISYVSPLASMRLKFTLTPCNRAARASSSSRSGRSRRQRSLRRRSREPKHLRMTSAGGACHLHYTRIIPGKSSSTSGRMADEQLITTDALICVLFDGSFQKASV